MTVSVRHATPDDARAIAEVHVRSWQHAYRELLPADFLAGLPVERREAYWREQLTDPPPRSAVLVADEAGSLLGFAAIGPGRDGAGEDMGELYAIYLDPAAWGRGAGRALLEQAVLGLREAGFTSAFLNVFEANPRARRFYEAAGWHFDAVIEPIEIAGHSLSEVRYIKQLSRPVAIKPLRLRRSLISRGTLRE